MIGTTAALIAGGLSAAGAVGGAAIGSSAAGKAADTQAAAASEAARLQREAQGEALDFQKQQYLDSLNLLSPYYQQGTGALNELSMLLGITPGPAPSTMVQPPLTSAGAEALLSPDQQAKIAQLNQEIQNRKNVLSGQGGWMGWKAGEAPKNPKTIGGLNSQIAALESQIADIRKTAQASPRPALPAGATGLEGGPISIDGSGSSPLIDGWTGKVITDGGQAAPMTASSSNPAFGSLLTPFSQTDWQKDPGYDFRLAEGQKALERSAAARGGLLTGGTTKALSRYGQDYAANEYQNAYNRYVNDQTNTYNRLANTAGLGQTSANALTTSGANNAANLGGLLTGGADRQSDLLTGAANARASGYLYGANNTAGAINSGIGNFASLYDLLRKR